MNKKNGLHYLVNVLLKVFNPKIRILIFGAGSGGKSAYQAHKNNFKVIGFVDNNKQKHGQHFCHNIIYSPAQIMMLNYDYILVASDYADEISDQLVREFNISSKKIFFNSIGVFASNNSFQRLLTNFKAYIINILTFQQYSILYKLLSYFFKHLKQSTVHKVCWLDEQEQAVLSIFRPSFNFTAVGPKFINNKQAKKEITVPSVKAYLFHDATTTTTSRSWVLNDYKVIVERLPYFDTRISDYCHGQISQQNDQHALISNMAPLVLPRGILISGVSDTNYYHWLIEILPQLQYVDELPNKYDNFPILISEKITNILTVFELFSYIQITRPIIYLKSNINYKVKNLIVIDCPNLMLTNLKKVTHSPVDSSFIRPESLNYIRDLGLKIAPISKSSYGPRIFLARKGRNRQYNQGGVIELLLKYDFEIIFPEDLHFFDQVRCIRDAKIIIAPSGAALANLIFSNKNLKVLYWAAASNGDASCFSNIAENMNFSLDCIGYQVPSSSTRETYYLPYIIDIKTIKKWVEQQINSEGMF